MRSLLLWFRHCLKSRYQRELALVRDWLQFEKAIRPNESVHISAAISRFAQRHQVEREFIQDILRVRNDIVHKRRPRVSAKRLRKAAKALRQLQLKLDD